MSRAQRADTTYVRYTRRSLPLLWQGDVIVVGGSFAGVAAALTFARTGRQVILLEPRTYLGREMTATLRPWVAWDDASAPDSVPELIRSCLEPGHATRQEIPLKPDTIKLRLEELLLASDVKLLYACHPVGVLAADADSLSLIIGNKSGRQVVSGAVLVDATATATVARVAGATFEPQPTRARFSRTLEFDGVTPLEAARLSVPPNLGLVGDQVWLHAGYRDDEHVLVEAVMELGATETGLAGMMQREIAARHRTMQLATHLISKVPAFGYALLAGASYELHGPQTSAMAGPTPAWATEFGATLIVASVDAHPPLTAPLSAFAGPVRQIWCLNEGSRLERSQAARLRDPSLASLLGTALAQRLMAQPERQGEASTTPRPKLPHPSGAPIAGLHVRELPGLRSGRAYETYTVTPSDVPVYRSAQVIVVGGGTSGATAAITSAQEGVDTLLLEMNPGLGGTGTLGGVDSYWFGRRVGFAARVSEWVAREHDNLEYEGRRWNIEAKQHALLRQADRMGVELVWNTAVIGALVEPAGPTSASQRERVRGVVAATRYGPIAVLADTVIDATGDGDVAAFAGADLTYGSARDHVVMWYSLAQFRRPGRTQNNFTSMVDVSNVEDYTRAILAGRRRGEGVHDHGIYLAPRESRHILGEVVLTLTDQLRQRQWPDVVNLHFSNHDIKGHTGSDWLRHGLIPPNLEVEVPYRALLPRGLEGVLVAGKAISATHDALPAIRMQADLENLGGVVALAAAQALRTGVAPRHIDVAALQRRLVDKGLLPAGVLTRALPSREYSDDELRALIDALDGQRPLYAYSDMRMDDVFEGRIPFVEICTAGPRAIPLLEKALASADASRKVRIAQALSLVGSRAGVPILIAKIEEALADGRLPARETRIRHSQLPPDQGAMPDTAYLIYALGTTPDPQSLRVWEQVAALLQPTEESIRDRYQGVFYYVDAVCFGAERLGDRRAIPILSRMHAHLTLRDQVQRTGFQPDYFQERQAMLELSIGRALARCGDTTGLSILIAYLEDNRALLAKQAHSELMALSNRDYGREPARWRAWFKEVRHTWKPKPYDPRNGK